jgi:hypothetical protein
MGAAKQGSGKPEYAVARGRTLDIGGKSIGPGQPVDLPEEDVDHLVSAGFLVKVDGDSQESSFGVRVGGLQIKGGRRPGGAVV